MNSIKFIPTMGEIAQLSGDTEPDIFDTANAAPRLKDLYTSITNFGTKGSINNYGSSSELSNTRIYLTEAGRNIDFLEDNSGLLGSLLFGKIIDHVTHPRTMHGHKKTHNVYDEYRWSATLNTQGCDVSNLNTNNGNNWFFNRRGTGTNTGTDLTWLSNQMRNFTGDQQISNFTNGYWNPTVTAATDDFDITKGSTFDLYGISATVKPDPPTSDTCNVTPGQGPPEQLNNGGKIGFFYNNFLTVKKDCNSDCNTNICNFNSYGNWEPISIFYNSVSDTNPIKIGSYLNITDYSLNNITNDNQKDSLYNQVCQSRSYGCIPISQIFNRIRNLKVNTLNQNHNGILNIYNSNNNLIKSTATVYSPGDIPRLGWNSTTENDQNINNETHLAKILIDTGGYTSHSKRIKYWDSIKNEYTTTTNKKKFIDRSGQEFGWCCKVGPEDDAKLKNGCFVSLDAQVILGSDYDQGNDVTKKPRTKVIIPSSPDITLESVKNTNGFKMEGGIIDNASAITNLTPVNSNNQCNSSVWDFSTNSWVDPNSALGAITTLRKKDDNVTPVNVEEVYYPNSQKYDNTKTINDIMADSSTSQGQNQPVRYQYQIISDFENDPRLRASEWGLLDAKGGLTSSNDLQNILNFQNTSPKPQTEILNQLPKLSYENICPNQTTTYTEKYIQIVKDQDMYNDSTLPSDSVKKAQDGGTCLQLRTSTNNPLDGTQKLYSQSIVSPILCSAMAFGSGELTVEAKFPPCTGGIFAMWTFRSDVCSGENGQGVYSLDNTAGLGEKEDIINPSMVCELGSPPQDSQDQYIPFAKKDPKLTPVGTNLGVQNVNPKVNLGRIGGTSGTNFIVSFDKNIKIDFGPKLYPINPDDPNDSNYFYKDYKSFLDDFSINIDCYWDDYLKDDTNLNTSITTYSTGFMQMAKLNNPNKPQPQPGPIKTINIDDINTNGYGLPTHFDSKNKIAKLFNPLNNNTYIDTSGGNLDYGNATRNDEIDIEIPTNSPGCPWSKQYWLGDIPTGWFCSYWVPDGQSSTTIKPGDVKTPLHMGMWFRMNGNSYVYTNGSGSGAVPYVNMWSDAACMKLSKDFGFNYNSGLNGPTYGGALMCPNDGYSQIKTDPVSKRTPLNCYNNTSNSKTQCDDFLKANRYIEIMGFDGGIKENVEKWINTNNVPDASTQINCVRLRSTELFPSTNNPARTALNNKSCPIILQPTRTQKLDEKWHKYTISWISGSPPLDKGGNELTPENPGEDDQLDHYWDVSNWRIKPCVSFYIDGVFQMKTSAFIPRRYSRYNIGFIKPSAALNWYGPFPKNVKYAHTYIKKITITPFITENDNINTAGIENHFDESLSDYWWLPWKDSPSTFRKNGGGNSFYIPLRSISKSSTEIKDTEPYWGTPDDDIIYKSNDDPNAVCHSDKIVITDGSSPPPPAPAPAPPPAPAPAPAPANEYDAEPCADTDTVTEETENCRIVFMKDKITKADGKTYMTWLDPLS